MNDIDLPHQFVQPLRYDGVVQRAGTLTSEQLVRNPQLPAG
jgi:hypothetical protein